MPGTGAVHHIRSGTPDPWRFGADDFLILGHEGVLSNAEAGRCAPQPLCAQPRLMLWPYDTVCKVKSKLLQLFRECRTTGTCRRACARIKRKAPEKPAKSRCRRGENRSLQNGKNPGGGRSRREPVSVGAFSLITPFYS